MFYKSINVGELMQVNNLINHNSIQNKPNFRGNNTTDTEVCSNETCAAVPAETSRAYASAQMNQDYKITQNLDVPCVGKGRVYELANGHKIVLVPKAGPTVIYTSIGAGHLNEPGGTKQVSHLLEHLLDNNCSGKRTPDVEEILSRTGADYNAMTSNYSTNYFLKAPIQKTEDLEDLLKVQVKTLQNVDFSDQAIEDEKKIITQELDSRGFMKDNEVLTEKMTLQNIFNMNETDDIVTQASPESIQNIKKEDLVNYYNNFYKPDNMVTTIVGAVDDNTIKTVAKTLGKMQPIDTKNKTNYPQFSAENLIQKTVRQDVKSEDPKSKLADINLSFVGPKNNDDQDNLKLEAFKEVIRNRFEKAEKGIDGDTFFTTYSSVFSSAPDARTVLSVTGKCKNSKCEGNLETLYTILNDTAQNPVSDEELNKMKKSMTESVSANKESAFDIASSFTDMLKTSQSLNEKQFAQGINSLTAKDIQEIAQKYVDLNKASLVVVHPINEKADDASEAKKVSFKGLNSASASKANLGTNEVSFKGKIDQVDSKDIHEYVLPNNLRVVLDSRPGTAKTAISFQLHSQKSIYANPEAGSTLGAFLESEETKEKLNKENIEFTTEGNSQEITTQLSGDAGKTLEMLGYAAGIALKPDFSPDVFKEYKKIKIEDATKDEPSIRKAINDEFLKESPYHYTKGDMKNLTIEDVQNLHQQILDNAQGTVFITIPKDKLEENKDKIFDTLMKVPNLQPYNYNTIFNKVEFKPFEKTKLFTKTEDSTQVEVGQYFKIIESGNIKDRAGLMVLNEVLGGSDKSLLFAHLRDEDKISYSADSSYDIAQSTGKMSRIVMGTTVAANSENLHKVFDEFKNCINELTTKPITPEDLAKIKTKLKNNIIYETESSTGKNDSVKYGYNSFYGTNYQEELFNAIDSMTPEYIQGLAKLYLTKPSLISVSGNKELIESQKDYLANMGDVTNLLF